MGRFELGGEAAKSTTGGHCDTSLGFGAQEDIESEGRVRASTQDKPLSQAFRAGGGWGKRGGDEAGSKGPRIVEMENTRGVSQSLGRGQMGRCFLPHIECGV